MDWTYLLLPVAAFCVWKAIEAKLGLDAATRLHASWGNPRSRSTVGSCVAAVRRRPGMVQGGVSASGGDFKFSAALRTRNFVRRACSRPTWFAPGVVAGGCADGLFDEPQFFLVRAVSVGHQVRRHALQQLLAPRVRFAELPVGRVTFKVRVRADGFGEGHLPCSRYAVTSAAVVVDLPTPGDPVSPTICAWPAPEASAAMT